MRGDDHDPAVEMMANDSASAALGIEVVEVRPGYAQVTMTIDDRHLNGHRIAHGGYVFLLADTAFACACNSGRPTTVAATAEIDFIAAAHDGDVLIAEAVERATFGRSGITDVTVRRTATSDGPVTGDGDLIAEFRGRSRTLREPT
ncbi:MAG: hydroxyphenylacetyl-CoA thioesterase PaaI [Nitriliruptor sp.]